MGHIVEIHGFLDASPQTIDAVVYSRWHSFSSF